MKEQFVKTKICPFFSRGHCLNGSSCSYAHDQLELRPLPDLQRTKLCESVTKDFTCLNPHCSYAHSRDDLRASSDLVAFKTSLCFFHKKGKCLNGEKCRFAHGQEDLKANPGDDDISPKSGGCSESGINTHSGRSVAAATVEKTPSCVSSSRGQQRRSTSQHSPFSQPSVSPCSLAVHRRATADESQTPSPSAKLPPLPKTGGQCSAMPPRRAARGVVQFTPRRRHHNSIFASPHPTPPPSLALKWDLNPSGLASCWTPEQKALEFETRRRFSQPVIGDFTKMAPREGNGSATARVPPSSCGGRNTRFTPPQPPQPSQSTRTLPDPVSTNREQISNDNNSISCETENDGTRREGCCPVIPSLNLAVNMCAAGSGNKANSSAVSRPPSRNSECCGSVMPSMEEAAWADTSPPPPQHSYPHVDRLLAVSMAPYTHVDNPSLQSQKPDTSAAMLDDAANEIPISAKNSPMRRPIAPSRRESGDVSNCGGGGSRRAEHSSYPEDGDFLCGYEADYPRPCQLASSHSDDIISSSAPYPSPYPLSTASTRASSLLSTPEATLQVVDHINSRATYSLERNKANLLQQQMSSPQLTSPLGPQATRRFGVDTAAMPMALESAMIILDKVGLSSDTFSRFETCSNAPQTEEEPKKDSSAGVNNGNTTRFPAAAISRQSEQMSDAATPTHSATTVATTPRTLHSHDSPKKAERIDSSVSLCLPPLPLPLPATGTDTSGTGIGTGPGIGNVVAVASRATTRTSNHPSVAPIEAPAVSALGFDHHSIHPLSALNYGLIASQLNNNGSYSSLSSSSSLSALCASPAVTSGSPHHHHVLANAVVSSSCCARREGAMECRRPPQLSQLPSPHGIHPLQQQQQHLAANGLAATIANAAVVGKEALRGGRVGEAGGQQPRQQMVNSGRNGQPPQMVQFGTTSTTCMAPTPPSSQLSESISSCIDVLRHQPQQLLQQLRTNSNNNNDNDNRNSDHLVGTPHPAALFAPHDTGMLPASTPPVDSFIRRNINILPDVHSPVRSLNFHLGAALHHRLVPTNSIHAGNNPQIGQVHAPQIGQVHAPQIGQVHAPQIGQVHAPQIGQVHAPQIGQVHAPQIGQMHAPQVGQMHAPQVGQMHAPQVGQVHAPQVGQMHAPQVGQMHACSNSASRYQIPLAVLLDHTGNTNPTRASASVALPVESPVHTHVPPVDIHLPAVTPASAARDGEEGGGCDGSAASQNASAIGSVLGNAADNCGRKDAYRHYHHDTQKASNRYPVVTRFDDGSEQHNKDDNSASGCLFPVTSPQSSILAVSSIPAMSSVPSSSSSQSFTPPSLSQFSFPHSQFVNDYQQTFVANSELCDAMAAVGFGGTNPAGAVRCHSTASFAKLIADDDCLTGSKSTNSTGDYGLSGDARDGNRIVCQHNQQTRSNPPNTPPNNNVSLLNSIASGEHERLPVGCIPLTAHMPTHADSLWKEGSLVKERIVVGGNNNNNDDSFTMMGFDDVYDTTRAGTNSFESSCHHDKRPLLLQKLLATPVAELIAAQPMRYED